MKAREKRNSYYLRQGYLWDSRCSLQKQVRSLGEKLIVCDKHLMAYGELLRGTWLGKPAASLLLHSALKQPGGGGGVGARWQCGRIHPRTVWPKAVGLARYTTTYVCRLPPAQQDSPRRPLCALCSQKVCDKQEAPTSTISSTHAPPWGNRCSKAGPALKSFSWLPLVI